MVFDFLGEAVTVLDHQGNPVPVYRYGESPPDPGLIDSSTPADAKPVSHPSFLGLLTFSDEFQDAALNTEKWLPNYPDTSFWNATTPGGHLTNTNEPQGYDTSGITFNENGMVLTFREDNAAVPELAYTSGMVASYPSFNQLYGYFEARMLLPNAEDAWPAFWLFPTDQVWPPEIDIMENDGKDSFNLQTYHTFHYPRPTPGGNSSTPYGFPEDVGNDFHVFGALWEPGRIRWYVDGDLVKDLVIEPEYADKNMFLICNLAGAQNSTPVAPFSLEVDYIRAWSI